MRIASISGEEALALDKSRTSLGVKIVLIFVAVAMVGYLAPTLFGLFGSSGKTANTNTDVLASIASQYTSTVAANDSVLRSDPASYTILVNQGNTYFDWALKVQQASASNQALLGSDQPMWLSAQQYYARAQALKADDPPVNVDHAITLFYSGETTKAIGVASAVTKKHADFAPGWFNLGVFYSSIGNNAVALAALEKAVALDPKGASINLTYAQQQIATLKGSTSATTTP